MRAQRPIERRIDRQIERQIDRQIERSRRRVIASAAVLLGLLAACSGPTIGWHGITSAEDPEPEGDLALRAYKESHYRELGSRFVATLSEDDVLAAIGRRRVVFVGDHHLDRALHARHLALLGSLAQQPLAFALEAIGTEDQAAVDRYLAGTIELDELCARMRARWPGSWLDADDVDAAYYRALLALARRSASPVVALEPTPRPELRVRDAGMAATIAAALEGIAADRLLVVVVGHTHLLGTGGLVARIDAPSTVLGARMSNTLRASVRAAREPVGRYLLSDRGVLFPPEAR